MNNKFVAHSPKIQRRRNVYVITIGILVLGLVLYLNGTPQILTAGRPPQPGDKTITVIADYNYPPYEFMNENGKAAGYNVDLLKAIAEELNVNIQINVAPWTQARAAFENGETDVLNMFYSEERDKEFDFSSPYIVVYHAIFVRTEETAIEGLKDLKGKQVIVQEGDIMHDYALENDLDAELITVESPEDALRLLSLGKYDCALLIYQQGLYLKDRLQLINITTAGELFYATQYAFAVHEGDTTTLELLNKGLSILKANGRYNEIYDQWFGVARSLSIITFRRYLLLAIMPIVFLLIGFGYWTWSLTRRIQQLTYDFDHQDQNRQRTVVAMKWQLIWVPTTMLFVGLMVVIWLNEILDIPNLLLGAPPSPINLREAIFESLTIIIIAGVSLSRLIQGINERKDAEEELSNYRDHLEELVEQRTVALRESQKRLELALQGADLALWDWNVQTGELQFNQRWASMLGYASDEVPKDINKWQQLVHPEDIADIIDLLSAHLKGNNPLYDNEYRLRTKDGRWKWILDRGKIIERDGSGIPLRMAGTNLDINDRKQANEALQKSRSHLEELLQSHADANAELARANRLKDEFLANMSHELRTPLSAILAKTEIMQEGIYGPLNKQQVNALSTINESGQHLLSLITDILDLAKINAGKMDLNYEQLVIQEVCDVSLRMVKQLARKKRIKITSTFDARVVTMYGDALRLKQILVNLLNNAVKFTPEGGEIGLEIIGDIEQETVYFTVWDTGIGIAPEKRELLFRPFVQIDGSLTRKHEGTGLGLALVYQLVNQQNGSITVESTVGVGSRFIVALPWQTSPIESPTAITVPELETERMPMSDIKPEKVKATILLAEDNEWVSEAIADYLPTQGYGVVIARNGQEALEMAAQYDPNLILMDIQMPEMNGMEAIQHLRAQAKFSHTPIIALTALVMPGDAEQCLAAGANSYLSKPVSLKDLVLHIDEMLNHKPAIN
ncbi:MAG: transporter substrate-binding domain-containing protein [Anaerolineae bacterium]|nr:transporter substrate-binding domain-containing protein [Anaerolineae bacterium]